MSDEIPSSVDPTAFGSISTGDGSVDNFPVATDDTSIVVRGRIFETGMHPNLGVPYITILTPEPHNELYFCITNRLTGEEHDRLIPGKHVLVYMDKLLGQGNEPKIGIVDERLIEYVRHYEYLWNPTNEDHKNTKKKLLIWLQIAKGLINFKDGDAVRARWKNLVDSFRAARLRRIKKSGQAAKQLRPWKYKLQMTFLNDHIAQATSTSSNIPKSSQIDKSEETRIEESTEDTEGYN